MAALAGAVKAYVTAPAGADGNDARVDALNTVVLLVAAKKEAAVKELIVALGAYLTASAATTAAPGTPDAGVVQRQAAVALLSEVFVRLPQLSLSDGALQSVTEFYLSRLVSDSACVKELLHGLFAIVKNHNFPTEQAAAAAAGAGAQAAGAVTASGSTTAPRTPLAAAVLKVIPGGLPAVQTLVQTARKYVYDLIVALAHKYPHEVLRPASAGGNGGMEWVGAYMRAMDGEKDPRNLMNAFWVVEFIARQFHPHALAPQAAELFDITSCYFPISFKPPANDPYGITGDDLRMALRSAFVATPLFGAPALPLCLEKVEAAQPDVKVDALQTLTQCVNAYPRDVVLPFVGDIWQCLTKEALLSADAPVVNAALDVIRAVWRLLLPDAVAGFRFHAPLPQGDNAGQTLAQTNWFGPCLSDCLEQLKQPDSKMARLYCGRVLSTAASASENSCERVWHAFWPAAKQKLASPHLQPSQRQAVVELVSSLVAQSAAVAPSSTGAHPLSQYSAELVTLYSSALLGGHVEYRLAAIAGLSTLAGVYRAPEPAQTSTAPAVSAAAAGSGAGATATAAAAPVAEAWSLLSAEQLTAIVSTFTQLVLFRDADAHVRAKALDALVTLSTAPNAGSGALVVTHTLPACLKGVALDPAAAAAAAVAAAAAAGAAMADDSKTLLPLAAANAAGSADTERYPYRTTASSLNAIARLSSASSACCAVALPTLLDLVKRHFSDAVLVRQAGDNPKRAFVAQVLSSLRAIIVARTSATSSTGAGDASATAMRAFGPVLLQLLISSAKQAGVYALHDGIVRESTAILQRIAQTLDPAAQQTFITSTVEAFAGADSSFNPLSVKPPSRAQWSLVPAFAAIVGSARAKEAVSVPHVDALLQQLFPVINGDGAKSVTAPADAEAFATVQRAAIQLVAAILNKAPAASAEFKLVVEQFIPYWHRTVDAAVSRDAGAANSNGSAAVALDALLWCTKALVLRAHTATVSKLGVALVGLVSGARDPALAIAAAHGFDLIMTDADAASSSATDAAAADDNAAAPSSSSPLEVHTLTRASHAQLAMLHAQRFFALVLPHVLTAYRAAAAASGADAKANTDVKGAGPAGAAAAGGNPHTPVCLLLSVSHLLRRVPRAVLVDSLPTTLPLLVQSLSATPAAAGSSSSAAVVVELWVSTLATFAALLRDSGAPAPGTAAAAGGGAAGAGAGAAAAAASAKVAGALSADIGTLVPAVLALTTYAPAQRVRLAALDVLEALLSSGLAYATVYPHRQPVLNALGAGAINDPKRAVRMSAVRVRNEWFVMTAGGVK